MEGRHGGAAGMPTISIRLGLRLESSSLPSNLPQVQLPKTGEVESLAGWMPPSSHHVTTIIKLFLDHFFYGPHNALSMNFFSYFLPKRPPTRPKLGAMELGATAGAPNPASSQKAGSASMETHS
jgi:hypothetical protein